MSPVKKKVDSQKEVIAIESVKKKPILVKKVQAVETSMPSQTQISSDKLPKEKKAKQPKEKKVKKETEVVTKAKEIDITPPTDHLTPEQEKQIQEIFKQQLTDGQMVAWSEIKEIAKKFNVQTKVVSDRFGEWQYFTRPNRKLGFTIEKTYFQLLPEWNDSMWKLFFEIAKQLNLHPKKVGGWINFINFYPTKKLAKVPLPENPEHQEQILNLYQQYLQADELPTEPLHQYIANVIGNGLTTAQVHKILAEYRQQVRKTKFKKMAKVEVESDPAATTISEG